MYTESPFFEFTDSFFLVLKDGIIIDANKVFLCEMNYSKEALVGQPFASLSENKVAILNNGDVIVIPTVTGDQNINKVKWECRVSEEYHILKGTIVFNEIIPVLVHDLKSPLRAIKNLIAFIEEEEGNKLTKASQEDFAAVVRRTDRMSVLIDNVLTYSKIGSETARESNFSPKEIINEVVDQTLKSSPKAIFTITGDTKELLNKEIYFFQVIFNIIENSIVHSTKEVPEVEILLKQAPKKVIIELHDNGPGIPSAFRSSVFEVFKTLQSNHNSAQTGLGLAAVKKMMKLLCGTVYIKDSKKGGVCFVIEMNLDN